MEPLKTFALSLCACIVFFALLIRLAPRSDFAKYVRTIINFLFILLIFSGVRTILKSNIGWSALPEVSQTENDTEQALQNAVIEYLNDALAQNRCSAVCKEVRLVSENGSFQLSSVTISDSDGIDCIQTLTGLEKEKIYVEST